MLLKVPLVLESRNATFLWAHDGAFRNVGSRSVRTIRGVSLCMMAITRKPFTPELFIDARPQEQCRGVCTTAVLHGLIRWRRVGIEHNIVSAEVLHELVRWQNKKGLSGQGVWVVVFSASFKLFGRDGEVRVGAWAVSGATPSGA